MRQITYKMLICEDLYYQKRDRLEKTSNLEVAEGISNTMWSSLLINEGKGEDYKEKRVKKDNTLLAYHQHKHKQELAYSK